MRRLRGESRGQALAEPARICNVAYARSSLEHSRRARSAASGRQADSLRELSGDWRPARRDTRGPIARSQLLAQAMSSLLYPRDCRLMADDCRLISPRSRPARIAGNAARILQYARESYCNMLGRSVAVFVIDLPPFLRSITRRSSALKIAVLLARKISVNQPENRRGRRSESRKQGAPCPPPKLAAGLRLRRFFQ